MPLILHIVERDRWNQAQAVGTYRADSLITEGFIHCSTADQIVWVANQFYRHQTGLVLLCIDPDRVQAPVKFESVEGAGSFPHVYGELNLDAIVNVLDFEPNADGSFIPPNLIS